MTRYMGRYGRERERKRERDRERERERERDSGREGRTCSKGPLAGTNLRSLR